MKKKATKKSSRPRPARDQRAKEDAAIDRLMSSAAGSLIQLGVLVLFAELKNNERQEEPHGTSEG